MLVALAIVLGLAGVVLRQVAMSPHRASRAAFAAQWRERFAAPRAGHELGDPRVVARIVGDPAASPAMLDVLAHELACQDWIPSDRLLDQLRRWARAELAAQRALDAAASRGDRCPSEPDPTHPRGRTP